MGFENISSSEQVEALIAELLQRKKELQEIEEQKKALRQEMGEDAKVLNQITSMEQKIAKMEEELLRVRAEKKAKVEMLFEKYGKRVELLGLKMVIVPVRAKGATGVRGAALDAVRGVLARAEKGMTAAEVAVEAGLPSATSQLNRLRALGEATSDRGVWYKAA